MSNNYKIREVHIETQPGVTLVVDLSSTSELKKLLNDLSEEKLLDLGVTKDERVQGRREQPHMRDDPASRVEMRANIRAGALASSNVMVFKDNVPQLLRPSRFSSVVDGALVLLFAVEVGLKNTSISYDFFKALYEDQNIKSGSPLPMLLTNLRNAGYLDKKVYAADRTLRLTAKGDKKTIEVLKASVGSN